MEERWMWALNGSLPSKQSSSRLFEDMQLATGKPVCLLPACELPKRPHSLRNHAGDAS